MATRHNSNGGFIGATADFSDDHKFKDPVYVGGQTLGILGQATAYTLNFALTGGIASVPAIGDVVIVAFSAGSIASASLAVTGYTQLAFLYSSDTYDTILYVGYKVLSAADTTLVTSSIGTGSTSNAGAFCVQVWRNIDTTTPIDQTTTTATGLNTAYPIPPAITPVSNRSVIIAVSASGHIFGTTAYASYPLPYARTVGGSNDTYDTTLGITSFPYKNTAAIYPVPFFVNFTDSTSYSWAAATVALRPALATTVPNQGIWNIRSAFVDLANYKFETDNLYFWFDAGNASSYPGSGATWTDVASGNNATLIATPTFTSAGTSSYFTFNGSTQGAYLTAPFKYMRDSSFTLSGWINTSTASGKKILGVENTQTGTASGSYDLNVYVNTSGYLAWGAYDGAAYQVLLSTTTVTTGNWVNFAVTYNKSSPGRQVYINGLLQASDSIVSGDVYTPIYMRIAQYALGSWPLGTTGYFPGNIAMLSMHAGVLSADQIASNFYAHRGRYGV